MTQDYNDLRDLFIYDGEYDVYLKPYIDLGRRNNHL